MTTEEKLDELITLISQLTEVVHGLSDIMAIHLNVEASTESPFQRHGPDDKQYNWLQGWWERMTTKEEQQ